MSETHVSKDGEKVQILATPEFQEKIMKVMVDHGMGNMPVVIALFNQGHFEMISNLDQEDIPDFLIDIITSRGERVGRMDLAEDGNVVKS